MNITARSATLLQQIRKKSLKGYNVLTSFSEPAAPFHWSSLCMSNKKEAGNHSLVESVIDLRSDTLTKPTKQMRAAMAEAEVGDDVYGEDPTVNQLESITADIFGKEGALFVPTGTMGNLISILSHCWERASEVILGDQSHIYGYEQGGIAQLGSVVPKAIPNFPDGTFSLDDVRRVFRTAADPHYARSAVIATENTMFGKVLPMSFMTDIRKLADELNLPIHLDGARVFNAASALNIPVKDIAQHVDTVNVCLSKSLGAPVGSIIIGSKEFITKTRRLRKCVGGGMRQAGVLAAAGIIAITDMTERLHVDHENALLFAKALQKFGPDVFEINMSDVQTNMVVFDVNEKLFSKHGSSETAAETFCRLLAERTKQNATSVKTLRFSPVTVRAVFHGGITEEDTETAIRKIHHVIQTMDK